MLLKQLTFRGGGAPGARRSSTTKSFEMLAAMSDTGSSFSSALFRQAARTWHAAEVSSRREQRPLAARAESVRRERWLAVLGLLGGLVSAGVVLAERVTGREYPGVAAGAFLGACALLVYFLAQIPSLTQAGSCAEDAASESWEWASALLAWVQQRSQGEEEQAVARQRLLQDTAVTARETVEWVNKLLCLLWPNALAPQAASQLEAALLAQLWREPPPNLKDVRIEQLTLGQTSPQVSASTGVCWTALSAPAWHHQKQQQGLCFGVEWVSSGLCLALRLTLEDPEGRPGAENRTVRVLVSRLRLSGTVRAVPVLDSCALLWGFAHRPALKITATVSPGPGTPGPHTDTAEAGASAWLESCIQAALASHLVEPMRQLLPLSSQLTSSLAFSQSLPPGPLSLSLSLLSASFAPCLDPNQHPPEADPPEADPPEADRETAASARSASEGENVRPRDKGPGGPVVVEVSCGLRVLTSAPGVPGGAAGLLEWGEGAPMLLAAGIRGLTGERVEMRAYEMLPAGPQLLGKASLDLRVVDAAGGRRYAVAWGVGCSQAAPAAAHAQGHASLALPCREGCPAVACVEAAGRPQRLALGLLAPEGPGGPAGAGGRRLLGQVEVALLLSPSVQPPQAGPRSGDPSTGEQAQSSAAGPRPGTGGGMPRPADQEGGLVLRVGVLEARDMGPAQGPAVVPRAAQRSHASSGMAIRVSYGGVTKATSAVADPNPVWRQTFNFPACQLAEEPSSSQPPHLRGFFAATGAPNCNGDAAGGVPASGIPGPVPGLPRFLHLSAHSAQGQWSSWGGADLGCATLDLWSLPDLSGASPSTLWVPLHSITNERTPHKEGTSLLRKSTSVPGLVAPTPRGWPLKMGDKSGPRRAATGQVKLALQCLPAELARAQDRALSTAPAGRAGQGVPGGSGSAPHDVGSGTYLGVLLRSAQGLPGKSDAGGAAGAGMKGGAGLDLFATVGYGSVVRKTKVTQNVSGSVVWEENMWFEWDNAGAAGAGPAASGFEIVVRENLSLGARAAAAATAALTRSISRSAGGASGAGLGGQGQGTQPGAGVVARGFLPWSELAAIRDWPHRTSVPLALTMRRSSSLAALGRRSLPPSAAASPIPARVSLAFCRASSPEEALSQLLPATVSHISRGLSGDSSDGALPRVDSALSTKVSVTVPDGTVAADSKNPLLPAAAAGGPQGLGVLGARQQQIQQASSQLSSSVEALKAAVGEGDENGSVRNVLENVTAAAQRQQRLMEDVVRDRDLVLSKVQELKLAMAEQAQVAAATNRATSAWVQAATGQGPTPGPAGSLPPR